MINNLDGTKKRRFIQQSGALSQIQSRELEAPTKQSKIKPFLQSHHNQQIQKQPKIKMNYRVKVP